MLTKIMTLVTPTVPSPGDEANATDISVPVNELAAVINGGLDDTNISGLSGSKIAAGTITASQLGTDAVETAKIKDGAVTATKVAAGIPVQIVSTNYSAVATGSTAIPVDDTIPQITEGDQFMSLAITPKSTTNKLVIEVVFSGTISVATTVVLALFQDSTANAIAATDAYYGTGAGAGIITLTHAMTAGTTSATTFTVRAGGSGTVTMNGAAGARRFGGITASSIKITEYKA